MKDYATAQARVLLRRLSRETSRAAEGHDPDSVHDLRVAVRRFGRCLRAFAQFFPATARKKIRRKLSGMMDAAAAVRDRDIALALVETAGVPAGSPMAADLTGQRDEAVRDLLRKARKWRDRRFADRWRKELEL